MVGVLRPPLSEVCASRALAWSNLTWNDVPTHVGTMSRDITTVGGMFSKPRDLLEQGTLARVPTG